jgi:hypothetical protein
LQKAVQFGRLRSAEKLANQVRLGEPGVRLWVPNLEVVCPGSKLANLVRLAADEAERMGANVA